MWKILGNSKKYRKGQITSTYEEKSIFSNNPMDVMSNQEKEKSYKF